MPITTETVKKMLSETMVSVCLSKDFASEQNIKWLESAENLKQARGMALAAAELIKAGIFNETTKRQLEVHSQYVKHIAKALWYLNNAKLLTIDNFHLLLEHLDNIKGIARSLLETTMPRCRVLNQDMFVKILAHAQYALGLGDCYSALIDANLLDEHKVNRLFPVAQHAEKIAKGLYPLVSNDILNDLYFYLLINNPEQSQNIGLILDTLIDAEIFDDSIRDWLLNNVEHTEMILISLCILKGINLLNRDVFGLITVNINYMLVTTFRLVITHLNYQFLRSTHRSEGPRETPAQQVRSMNEKIIIAAKELGIDVKEIPQEYICPFSCEIMDKPARNCNPVSITENRGDYTNMMKIAELSLKDPWTRGSMYPAHIQVDTLMKEEIDNIILNILKQIRTIPGHENDFPEFSVTPYSSSDSEQRISRPLIN